MTGPNAEENTPRRDYARLRLGVPAYLETLDGRLKVEIVDISQGGAHLILPHADSFAKDCLLAWLRFEVFGTVSWRDGAHIGMRFEEAVSQKAIVETRRQASAILNDDAAQTSHAARDWVSGAVRL